MIDRMYKPPTPDMTSIESRADFDAAVREGIEAADAGRLSPIEPVADWLASWGGEDELSRPE